MATNIGTLEAKLKLEGKQFIDGLSGASKEVEGFKQKSILVGKQLAKMGVAMGAAALAAGTYIGIQSVREFAKFESAIANVATLLEAGPGGVPTLMKDLQGAVLSLNPELGNATELADALYQVISADLNLSLTDAKTKTDDLSQALGTGSDPLTDQLLATTDQAAGLTDELSGQDKLNAQMAFLETAAYAATAGLTTTFVAVDAGTTILNAFGLTSGDATKIFDQMFKTVELGKTTFEALASNVGKVASTMASAKQPTEQMFAAIATLTKGIGSTEEATTSLNAIILALIKPGKEAAEMAESLGLEFNATALESKGLAQVMAEVKEKTGGNIEKMVALFQNVRALKGALLLAGSQSETFIGSLGEMEKSSGSVKTAFDKQATSLEHNVKAIGNLIAKIKIMIGEPLAKVVKQYAQEILAWAEANDKLIEQDIPQIAESTAKALGVTITWMIDAYKTRTEEDKKWKMRLEEAVLSLKNLGKIEKEVSQESMKVHLDEVVFKYLTTQKYSTLEQKDETDAHKEFVKLQNKIKLEYAKTLLAKKKTHDDFLEIQRKTAIDSIEAAEDDEERKLEITEDRFIQTNALLDDWTEKTERAAQDRLHAEEMAERGMTEITRQEWEKRWKFQKQYGAEWSELAEMINEDIIAEYGLAKEELKNLDESFLTSTQTTQKDMLTSWEKYNDNTIDDFELTVKEYEEKFSGDADSILAHIKTGLSRSIYDEGGFMDWKGKVFSNYDSVMNSAYQGMQDGFQTQFYDFFSGKLTGGTESIEAIWASMWEAMKQSMAKQLADMAAELLVNKLIIGGLALILDTMIGFLSTDTNTAPKQYAEGAWNVEEDELAQLHAGEIVIPAQMALNVREIFKTNWQSHVDESKKGPGIFAGMTADGIDTGGIGIGLGALGAGGFGVTGSDVVGGMQEGGIKGTAQGLSAIGLAIAMGMSPAAALAGFGQAIGLNIGQSIVEGSIRGSIPSDLGTVMGIDVSSVIGILGTIASVVAAIVGAPPIAVFALPMMIDIIGALIASLFGSSDALGPGMLGLGDANVGGSGITGANVGALGLGNLGLGDASVGGSGIGVGDMGPGSPGGGMGGMGGLGAGDAGVGGSGVGSGGDAGDDGGEGAWRLGTGLEGLPRTGSFFGHEGEIIASPEESDVLRSASQMGGAGNDVHLHLTVKVDGAREDIIIDKIIPVIKDLSALGEQILYAEGVIEAEG